MFLTGGEIAELEETVGGGVRDGNGGDGGGGGDKNGRPEWSRDDNEMFRGHNETLWKLLAGLAVAKVLHIIYKLIRRFIGVKRAEAAAAEPSHVVVVSGDTLSSIAASAGVSVERVLAANTGILTSAEALKPGMDLIIPHLKEQFVESDPRELEHDLHHRKHGAWDIGHMGRHNRLHVETHTPHHLR